jgi:hypothetical protein
MMSRRLPALNAVLNFGKNLDDLVFNGVRAAGLGLEALEVGEELAVGEIQEVIAGEGVVVVELAGLVLGRGPAFPAVGLVRTCGKVAGKPDGFSTSSG